MPKKKNLDNPQPDNVIHDPYARINVAIRNVERTCACGKTFVTSENSDNGMCIVCLEKTALIR